MLARSPFTSGFVCVALKRDQSLDLAGLGFVTVTLLAITHSRFGVATISTHHRIVRSVLRQGAAVAVAGVLAGGAVAVFAIRALQNFVWGVTTLESTTFAVVAVPLIAVAMIASLIPALRVVRLNPVTAR
jgi:putative ABC transport system permease protein